MAHIGRLVNLGIARESSRGAGAAATYWLPKTEFTFASKADKLDSMEAHGVIEDATDGFVAQKYAEGNVGGEIRDTSFGLFLYSLLGSVSSAVLETTAYNHTFTVSNSNQHQSLCFTVDSPIDDILFKLVAINSLEINVELGELVKYTANFMSRTHTDSTGLSASYTSENRFLSKHATIKTAAARGDLAAASGLTVKGVRLTISKNLERDNKLGSIEADDFLNKQLSVEGEITLNETDRTYRDYMLDEGTYRALSIDLANTDVTIGATSNPRLQIIMPRVHFFDWTPDRTLDEIAKQTIRFKGLYDVANSENSIYETILTNEATSY